MLFNEFVITDGNTLMATVPQVFDKYNT